MGYRVFVVLEPHKMNGTLECGGVRGIFETWAEAREACDQLSPLSKDLAWRVEEVEVGIVFEKPL